MKNTPIPEDVEFAVSDIVKNFDVPEDVTDTMSFNRGGSQGWLTYIRMKKQNPEKAALIKESVERIMQQKGTTNEIVRLLLGREW